MSTNSGKGLSVSFMSEFFIEVLKSCNRSQHNRSLCVLMLFEAGCLAYFPANLISLAFGVILKLQECGVNRLTAAVYRVFDSFFQLRSQLLVSSLSLRQIDENDTIAGTYSGLQLLLRSPPTTADMYV